MLIPRTRLAVAAAATLTLIMAGALPAAADGDPQGGGEGAVSVRTDVRHEPLHWGSDPTGAGTEVSFRYRADGVATSDGETVGGAQEHTVTRTAPLAPFHYLQLDGRDDAYVASAPITTRTDVGITIRVWFRSQADQRAVLFSNLGPRGGYALIDDHGRLRADYTTTGRYARTTRHTIETRRGIDVDDGQWHVAAVTVDVTGERGTRARLYVDNTQIARTRCDTDRSSWDGSCTVRGHRVALVDGHLDPVVGAQPNVRGLARHGHFTGQVHAVEVNNWPVDHDVLTTPALRDGGAYFGKPAYHDYAPGEPESDGTGGPPKWSNRTWDSARRQAWTAHGHPGSETPEQTEAIDAGMAKIVAQVEIPLLATGYTPQGIAISPDGRTMSIIYYYANDVGKNPAPGACGTDACPNVLVRADLTTKRVIGIYRLQDANGDPFGRQGSSYHANGLVDAHGHLYTALSTGRDPETKIVTGTVYRFTTAHAQLVAPANPSFDIPPVYTLRPDASYPVASSGSGMSYSPATDSLYLMGNYQPNKMADADHASGDLHSDGDIVGYRLTPSGDIAHPSTVHGDETFQLPDTDLAAYNQGLAWVGAEGDRQCFLLSRSEIYAHTGHSDPPVRGDWTLETILDWTSTLSRWCGNDEGGDADLTVEATLPAGLENVVLGPDGTVWSLTENSAYYYQKRTNHQEWYPFFTPYVFGIPLDRLGG